MDPVSGVLAQLGLHDADLSRVTFLCGAGVSYGPPTRLPTVQAFVEAAFRHCQSDIGALEAAMAPQDPPRRFEVLVEAIGQLSPAAQLLGSVFDSESPNVLHHFLGAQCMAGATVITTNFDNCIERTWSRPCERVVFLGEDLTLPAPSRAVLVKPHGTNPWEGADTTPVSLVASIRALARTARGFALFPAWRGYLQDCLNGRTVVVIGYSGSDDFDITPLLLDAAPSRVVWLDYDRDSPHITVADHSKASGGAHRICVAHNGMYLRGDLSQSLPPRPPDVRQVRASTKPSLETWLADAFPTGVSKQALLCVLLRHHNLHEETIRATSPPLSADALIERGTALYYRGRYIEACEALGQLAMYRPSVQQECRALYVSSAARLYRNEPAAAKEESLKHLALAESIGDVGEAQTALVNIGGIAFSLGDREEARKCYTKVVDYQARSPALQAVAMATWGLADIANVSGDALSAEKGYREAQVLLDQLGSSVGAAWMAANLGELLLRQGRTAEARKALAAAERRFGVIGNAVGSLFVLVTLARIDFGDGDLVAAQRRVDACLSALAGHQDSVVLPTAVALAYLLACDADAWQLLREVKTVVGRRFDSGHEARSGEAARRWEICRQVTLAAARNEPLYQQCLRIVSDVVDPDTTSRADAEG
jgi:tetratricopeptide (TPR) repeat protein